MLKVDKENNKLICYVFTSFKTKILVCNIVFIEIREDLYVFKKLG